MGQQPPLYRAGAPAPSGGPAARTQPWTHQHGGRVPVSRRALSNSAAPDLVSRRLGLTRELGWVQKALLLLPGQLPPTHRRGGSHTGNSGWDARQQRALRAMQSPPHWPPTPGALRPSPFPHPVLHGLHDLARGLLFPTYWALDRLLRCCAPDLRPRRLASLCATARTAAALLLLLTCLPLALPGLPLWLLLQVWRRPFCYQPPPHCWAPPAPWRPAAEPARSFGFLSVNVCLLPDGLARFNNLEHSQQRAEAVGAVLLSGLRSSRYGATGCSPPGPGAPGRVLISSLPAGLDFVCLQEVFDLRAARRLVNRLVPALGPVLYDVGTFGLQPGPHLKLLGSGLLLASRYPLLRAAFHTFRDARREDALVSKGLLSAQVAAHRPRLRPGRGGGPSCTSRRGWLGLAALLQAQLGFLDGHRVVGFLHCTHLHSPNEDGPVRSKQLTALLDWAEQFEAASGHGDEVVAFSVLLGDLNFDSFSPGDALEQQHQLFSRFRDPCRLGTRQEHPWALGTLLCTARLRHPVACSPELLLRALEQEEGRQHYLAGPPRGGPRPKPWRGRRLDYVTYRGAPGSPLSPVEEQVAFSTAFAGLTDHLAVGLQLRVSLHA
ncbi:Sphingomyelin phosphodiesterase 3 [Galemys pyrenaicus]|uniref:sphingomyelin phosphodiesterase n=1 Tax=Galemys pyrenaicus TaxID=202257 RepID=A0A8J6APE6_GALPY|nr:Sphingomyelin phosphodiesterase 3 [Galemys pyrenaicus]